MHQGNRVYISTCPCPTPAVKYLHKNMKFLLPEESLQFKHALRKILKIHIYNFTADKCEWKTVDRMSERLKVLKKPKLGMNSYCQD